MQPMKTSGPFQLSLFLFFSFAYLLTTPGHYYTFDSRVSYETTQSLVTKGTLEVSENMITVPDATGTQTGRYGLLQMILCVPLYVLGAGLDRLWPSPPFLHECWRITLVATFNQWISALALVVFFGILRGLGYGAKTCFIAALSLGFATPWWTYSRDLYRQPIAGLLFLWAIAATLEYGRTSKRRDLLALGVSLGLSINNRITSVVAWPGIFFLFLSRLWGGRKLLILRAVFGIGVLIVVGILLQIGVNYWRFNHWWGWAYAERFGWFSLSRLKMNIPDLLLSPSRGMVLYAPPIILIGHGLFATWRKDRALAVSILLMVTAKLFLFGAYKDYTGGMNPGARYLIPILPVAFIPVGVLVCEEWSNKSLRWSLYVLSFLGAIVNGFNCLIPYHLTLTFWQQVYRICQPELFEQHPPWNAAKDLYDVLVARWIIDGRYLALVLFLVPVVATIGYSSFRIKTLLQQEE